MNLVHSIVLIVALLSDTVAATADDETEDGKLRANAKSLDIGANGRTISTPRRQLLLWDFWNDFWNSVFGRSGTCPPEGFDALNPFNLDTYISARWFVQKQIPVVYSPFPDGFFCVSPLYIRDDSFCLFCNDKPRVIIDNGARRGGVDAPFSGGDPSPLFRGIVRNPETGPAKVSVGVLADLLAWDSNYWIVAAGTYDDARAFRATPSSDTTYDWAIIVGGSPTKDGANGKCLPDPGLFNEKGMWMFSRDISPENDVIDGINQIADNLGLDNTAWKDVEQAGCDWSILDD